MYMDQLARFEEERIMADRTVQRLHAVLIEAANDDELNKQFEQLRNAVHTLYDMLDRVEHGFDMYVIQAMTEIMRQAGEENMRKAIDMLQAKDSELLEEIAKTCQQLTRRANELDVIAQQLSNS